MKDKSTRWIAAIIVFVSVISWSVPTGATSTSWEADSGNWTSDWWNWNPAEPTAYDDANMEGGGTVEITFGGEAARRLYVA